MVVEYAAIYYWVIIKDVGRIRFIMNYTERKHHQKSYYVIFVTEFKCVKYLIQYEF